MKVEQDRSYPVLLTSMAAGDGAAWDRFFQLYYPMVISWARNYGCPSGMEDDVFQEVVLAVFQQLESLHGDTTQASFRGFLKTVTRHKVYDIFRRRREYQGEELPDDNTAWEDKIEDTDTIMPGMALDRVSMRVALHTALRAARSKVTPKTARMFEMYRILDMSPEAVAEELGVTTQVVYEAARRFRSEYLAPCFVQVIQELDESVSDAVSAKMLDKALDDLVRGQSQFELTVESPSSSEVRERVRYLHDQLSQQEQPQHAAHWLQLMNTADPNGPGPKPGEHLALTGDEILVGRLDGLSLTLPSVHVSGHHATLRRSATGWSIQDNGSRNGTYVNQHRLTECRNLVAGDIIQIGEYTMVYLSRLPAGTLDSFKRRQREKQA